MESGVGWWKVMASGIGREVGGGLVVVEEGMSG